MNQKTILLLNAVIFLFIIPFLILFFYNHPVPEDFFWSETVKYYGFSEAQKIFYNTWSGRYFSYILLSLNPLLFKSVTGFKIYLLSFFIIFAYSIFIFISAFTKNKLNVNERLLILFSILFLYLYSMPDVSEGLYWLTAVMIYPLGIILLMFFVVTYKKLTETKILINRNLYLTLSALLIFAVSGTSEINSALILCLNFLILFYNISKKNKLIRISIILTVLALASVLISFLSPGNLLRALEFENAHNPAYSLSMAYVFLIKNLSSWIFYSPLILFTFVLTPFLNKLIREEKRREENVSVQLLKNILVKSTVILSLTFFIIFFTLWNTGESPYGRTLNSALILFIFGWFYIYYLLLQLLNGKIKKSFLVKFRSYIIVISVLVFSLLLIKKNNIRNAYSDLLKGYAFSYNQKFEQRYEEILKDKSGNCEVDSIKNVPKSFFLYDITSDTDHFYNQWYSRYFNKNSIKLK